MKISAALEAIGAAAFVAAGFVVGVVPGLVVVGAVFVLAGVGREAEERRVAKLKEPPDDDHR